MLMQLRERVGDVLRRQSVHRHKSRFGWRESPAYTAYYKKAQAAFEQRKTNIAFPDEAEEFERKQFTSAVTEQSSVLAKSLRAKLDEGSKTGSFSKTISPEEWRRLSELEQLFRGDLGDFLRSVFRSEFKIFNAYFHLKKGGDIAPKEWHSDSAPGTCLNLFFYLSDGFLDYGPTAVLPWRESELIFRDEPGWARKRSRELSAAGNGGKITVREKAAFYENEISSRFPDKVEIPNGPAGTMVVFNNNCLHAAGSAKAGFNRLVAAFRVFPSIEPLDFERLSREGIPPRKANNPRAEDEF